MVVVRYLSSLVLMIVVYNMASCTSNCCCMGLITPSSTLTTRTAKLGDLMMMTMMTSTRRTRRTPTHLYAKESTEVKQQQQQRQPWNIFRFAQQTSKFVSFPFALPLNNNGNNNQKMIRPGDVLWTPTSTTSSSQQQQQQHEQRFFQWAPLDDVVMGGASYSTMDNGLGLWKGVVTDANNGGFVGIRTTPNVRLDLSPCRGLEFSLECPAINDDDDDNKNKNKDIVIMPRRLKVVLRDSTDFNGIAWTTTVNVPTNNNNSNNTKNNTVVKVKVPVNAKSLLPTIFARIVKNERTTSKDGISKTDITGLQLVYSKFELEGELNPQFQQGNFALKLLEVKAY